MVRVASIAKEDAWAVWETAFPCGGASMAIFVLQSEPPKHGADDAETVWLNHRDCKADSTPGGETQSLPRKIFELWWAEHSRGGV